PDQVRQVADRRRAEDELGALAGLRHRAGAAICRARLDRLDQALGVWVEAGHLGSKPPPRREPDRAADQAHAEDGDPGARLRRHYSLRRASIAEANRSSADTVSSQSMQGSVIDCP